MKEKYEETVVKLEQDVIDALPNIVWKLVSNMKNKEMVRIYFCDSIMQEC